MEQRPGLSGPGRLARLRAGTSARKRIFEAIRAQTELYPLQDLLLKEERMSRKSRMASRRAIKATAAIAVAMAVQGAALRTAWADVQYSITDLGPFDAVSPLFRA